MWEGHHTRRVNAPSSKTGSVVFWLPRTCRDAVGCPRVLCLCSEEGQYILGEVSMSSARGLSLRAGARRVTVMKYRLRIGFSVCLLMCVPLSPGVLAQDKVSRTRRIGGDVMAVDPIWDVIASWDVGQVPASHTRLIVATSPKVELMLVVAMLAAPTPSPGHYGTPDHPIPQAARAWFMPLADHPAVATVRRLFYVESERGSGFACDALTSFILRRTEPPGLEAQYPHSESVLTRAEGDSTVLDLLVEQLRDFYHSSHFASFWEEEAEAYRVIEEQVESYIKTGWAGEDVVATMESYFGEQQRVYVIVPTPMERPGGGTMDAMGAESSCLFACFDSTVDKEWVLHLLYHEFGHRFVNPLSERYDTLVRRYEGLYASLQEAMRPWGYVNWPVALNEHILRAQNCRLRREHLGDAAAEAQLSEEEAQGFQYIRALEAKLAEYEAHREIYPSLADFYPTLLTALDPFLSPVESSK